MTNCAVQGLFTIGEYGWVERKSMSNKTISAPKRTTGFDCGPSDLHGGIEPGVLDAMRSDSGATLDVAENFVDLCRDHQLEITSFFEERKSRLGKVIGRTDIEVCID